MINRRQRRLNRNCPTLDEALQRYLEEISPRKKSGYQEKPIARAWQATGLINRTLARITAHDLRRPLRCRNFGVPVYIAPLTTAFNGQPATELMDRLPTTF